MFNRLTDRIVSLAGGIGKGDTQAGRKRRDQALRELRDALVAADVELSIVDEFLLGFSKGYEADPAVSFADLLEEHLGKLLGGANKKSRQLLSQPPQVLVLVGPLGVGKTTMAAKIARYYREQHQSTPLLVTTDTQRAAAKEQMRVLAEAAHIPWHAAATRLLSSEVSMRSIDKAAKTAGADIVLVDTPGFAQDALQSADQLEGLRSLVAQLHEWRDCKVLYVLDATQGQGAVATMKTITRGLEIEAVALSRADGTGRGGAALSVSHRTGKAIVFSGTGERVEDLEIFHPDRIAKSLTGGGDIESVLEKAQQSEFDQDTIRATQRTLSSGEVTYDDVLAQFKQVEKQGGVAQMLKMLPHAMQKRAQAVIPDQGDLKYMRAVVDSMTPEERAEPRRMNASRKKRIVGGAGVAVKAFNDLKRMRSQFARTGAAVKSMAGAVPGGVSNQDFTPTPQDIMQQVHSPARPQAKKSATALRAAKKKKKQQRKARKKSRG